MQLIKNAEIDHEDAREWYSAYGWHYPTEHGGDVTLDAVEYDWLDGTDADIIISLRAKYPRLRVGEAEAIIEMARTVREAAETIEGLLDDVVQAYQRGDAGSVAKILDEAAIIEGEHGGTPATTALRAQILAESDD